MKILNFSDSTIVLDDINVSIPYSRNREPFEIPERMASRSRLLKSCLASGVIKEVKDGDPASLIPDPNSPYFQKQAMLSRNDPVSVGIPIPSVPNDIVQPALDDYKQGKMHVVWTGPATDAGGYARMNRKFMFGLSDRGVNVNYANLTSMNDMDPETNEKLRRLSATRVPKDAIKVYGQTAPLHYDWARYKMLFTMMETRRLHPDYVIRCNCADELVVPSHWCKKIFEESGVNRPISVVPLGVDTTIYRPDVEPIGFSKNLKPYVFLSVFGWSMRKGYDVLLKAYLEEFTGDDPVTLLISSRYFGSTDDCKKQVIRNDVARINATVSNPNKPHVVLFGDVLSDEMMPRLFAAADCYVLISRGEGFGLPYAEAGACNLPVIGSRYSSQTDFLDDDNSYLVDVDGFSPAEKELAMVSYFYENAEFPTFGDAAVEQTRYFMRRAFEKKDEAETKANNLYERISKEYDWDSCIEKMKRKLTGTYDKLIVEHENGKDSPPVR
jgi:glycosyltransferase involved in cell wall biosynthesis